MSLEREENLRAILFMLGVDPDVRGDAFYAEYHTNVYVYNLVNLFERLYAEHEKTKEELMDFCRFVMGDFEPGEMDDEKMRWRAFSVSKRLGTLSQRRDVYRRNELD